MSGGRRVVLAAIEANEPVLALKITGAGQRATLSALVKPGMKAVTIRVNDVEGVGGFVLPGDHVDVVLTRQIEKGSATTASRVAEHARARGRPERRRARRQGHCGEVGHARSRHRGCTEIMACVVSRQSLAAAAQGRRNRRSAKTRKITLNDLGTNEPVDNDKAATTTVVVTRASAKQEYTVPVEGRNGASAATGRRQVAW